MPELELEHVQLGFVGAGNMAQAMAFGFVKTGLLTADRVFASAPSDRNLVKWRAKGMKTTNDNREVVRTCNMVFLACKPYQLGDVLAEIKGEISEDKLLLSVIAGMDISFIENNLGVKCKVVWVMPSTPCLVLAGVSSYCCNDAVSKSDKQLVELFLCKVGMCFEIQERLMNAGAICCGAVPAFLFTAADALADGSVKVGLQRDLALKIAAHNLIGAGKMMLETGLHPAQLKDNICSPNGATICGIHALEKGGFRDCLISAIEDGVQRAERMSKD
ncbi:pyrroline-5-carboxylate reductase 3-like [Anneissia japonica]|uniref:pyrroline-5-carboxylate reductase 3-like n=1 Tax=Anneissia japonica TaxID=1529436 RepID=UPI0014259145|nr:pyrroline-5-carboxylate reductase 3-like [Anneissia japonica]